MVNIYPTILVKSKPAYIKLLNRYRKFFNLVQVDVANGSYVKSKSYYCRHTTGKLNLKTKLDLHLMIDRPLRFIKRWKNVSNVVRFYVHVETVTTHAPQRVRGAAEAWRDLRLELSGRKIELAMAISPKTSISALKPFIHDLKTALILGVIPGRNAAPFIPTTYKRIKQIKKLNPKIKVAVDGGVSPKTAAKLIVAGADILYSGSYLNQAADFKQAIKELT